MGLLDEAIREHLELKRLRGADPGEVAREQREALDPVPRDRRGGQDAHGELDADSAVLDGGEEIGENGVAADDLQEVDAQGGPEPAGDGNFSHVGQETAELDMRTVLGDEPSAPQDEPGDAEESAEDVLEETPDFLRDTPEQDRLWFEQQPPRDFDFNK